MHLSNPLALAAALLLPSLSFAEENSGESAQTVKALEVELNAADNVDDACKLTFLLRNGLDADVDQLTVETVLFSTDGQVILLTLFDFGNLPAGRPRVRQFEVPNLSCEGVGMLLINGADACTGEGLSPALCEDALSVTSRTDIRVEG